MHYYDVIHMKKCQGKDFDLLLSLGWYPMGQKVFTTSHLFKEDGSPPLQVHWLRFPVAAVSNRASHRRIRNKNHNFDFELAAPFEHRKDLDELYVRYLDSVNFSGYDSIGKATFVAEQDNIYQSKAIIIRDQGKVISCGIFSEGETSVASILHFFDPRYKRYSPGKYLILKTLDYCRDSGKSLYYPGYVIEGDNKMDYKLFLGEDAAYYYYPEPHPLSGTWKPYLGSSFDQHNPKVMRY